MAQQRLKRTMRGALAATAVAVAIGTAPFPATADPAPDNRSDALSQYHDLTGKAEKLNEDYLKAKDDLDARRDDLRRAKDDAAKAVRDEQAARDQQQRFRGRVDQLSDATLRGARFSKMSALMAGKSPQDFLDRASALQVISADNDDSLRKLGAAVQRAGTARDRASDAQRRAQDATDAAHQLVSDIQDKKDKLQDQIGTVKEALAKLTPSDRGQLQQGGSENAPVDVSGSGAAVQAMKYALSQQGVPYEWGGTSPSGFDCSGLTSWAFEKAGIDIPRSSQAQSETGTPVSRSELQPGDLVFFGSPVHHVGIYVGDGKMVNAPNFGEDVQVEPLFSEYSGARRVG